MGLTVDNRALGHERGLKKLTPAQRVRQRLSAGRKPERPSDVTLDDVARIAVLEAGRARGAMHAERLDAKDLHLGIIFALLPAAGLGEMVGCKWLPLPIVGFTEALGKLTADAAKAPGMEFIGMVWALLDREAARGVMWAKPLTSNTEKEKKLKLSQGLFKTPWYRN